MNQQLPASDRVACCETCGYVSFEFRADDEDWYFTTQPVPLRHGEGCTIEHRLSFCSILCLGEYAAQIKALRRKVRAGVVIR